MGQSIIIFAAVLILIIVTALTIISCKCRGRHTFRGGRIGSPVRSAMHVKWRRSKVTDSPPSQLGFRPVQVGSATIGSHKVTKEKEEHPEVNKTQDPQASTSPRSGKINPIQSKGNEDLSLGKFNDEPIITLKSNDEPIIKFRPQTSKISPRKNPQCTCHNPQNIRRESLKRPRHYFRYPSPRNKSTEFAKISFNRTRFNDCVDGIRTRWNGGVPICRTKVTRRRYPLPTIPVSFKLNSSQVKEQGKRRHRTTRLRMPILMKSSSPSPSIRKPSIQKNPHSSNQSTGSRNRGSSFTERRLPKRGKVHTLNQDVSSDAVSYKMLSRRENDSFNMMKIDWPVCFKSSENVRGRSKQNSPKKIKRITALSKSKKASGQKKKKKFRKKHKDKRKDKIKPTVTNFEEEASNVNTRLQNYVLHFPEPCRGMQVPSYLGQPPKQCSHNESFTIRRTATPVLSSLFGQGAFTTCWPQNAIKEPVCPTDEHDNENTGRHNTNFLGPKAQDSNNETTETVNSTKIVKNRIWDKSRHGCVYEERPEFMTDATRANDILIESVRFPGKKAFHFLSNERKEQFRETQVFKNIWAYNAIKATEKVSWKQHGFKDQVKSIGVENNLQFIASSHGDNSNKNLKTCNKQQHSTLRPHDEINEIVTVCGRTPTEYLHVSSKESNKLSEPYEFKRTATGTSIQCPQLLFSKQYFKYNETAPLVEEKDPSEKCLKKRYTDSKSQRDDFVRRHHSHYHECGIQFPQISVWTHPQEGTQDITSNDTKTNERQLMAGRTKGQTRIHSLVAGVSQVATSLKDADEVAPSEAQGSQSLWKTSVSKDGNVFRVTRNNIMPFLHHCNYSQNVHESTYPQSKHDPYQQTSCTLTGFQKETKDVPSCYRTDSKNETSIWSEAASQNDTSLERSRSTDKTNLHQNRQRLNENTQVIGQKFKMEDNIFRRDTKQNRPLCAAFTQKWNSKTVNSSLAPETHQLVSETQASLINEDFSKRRFIRRQGQCNSFVSSTVNETSNAASGSGSHEELTKQEKTIQTTENIVFDNLNIDTEQPAQNRFHFYSNKDCPFLPNIMDKNPSEKQIERQPWKVNERTDLISENLHIFRGHAVKKAKSLISLRGMLQELTSQVRGNQDNNQQKKSGPGRNAAIKTVLYFKPVRRVCKQSLDYQKRQNEYQLEPQYYHMVKSDYAVSSIETSGSYETNDDYVQCYRLKRYKSHRHEPYRKRTSTSSCNSNEPIKDQFWTRNKNNCSPSRAGRYVMGPLVDKHVFVNDGHLSGINNVKTSSSNDTPLQDSHQQHNAGIENIAVGLTTTHQSFKKRLDHKTQKHGILTISEAENTDDDLTSKESSSVADKESTFPVSSDVTQDHNNVGVNMTWPDNRERLPRTNAAIDWAQETKETSYIGQPILAAGKMHRQSTVTKFGHTVSVNQGQSCRRSATRNHAAVGSKGQTETRYTISQQSSAGCPTRGHNIKHTDVDVTADHGNVEQMPVGQAIKERNPKGQTRAYTNIRHGTTRYTATELRTAGRVELGQASARYTNAEINPACHTNFGYTATRHTPAETKAIGKTDPGYAAIRSTTAELRTVEYPDPGYAAIRGTTAELRTIEYPDPGYAAIRGTTSEFKTVEYPDPGYAAIRGTTSEFKTVEHPDPRVMSAKQSIMLCDQLHNTYFTVSSDHPQSASNSKMDKNTDNIDTLLCSQHISGSPEPLPKQCQVENTIRDLPPKGDNKSISVNSLNTASSKPKIPIRIKVPRFHYNHLNFTKNHAGRSRLRGIRRQLSFKHISSSQMETTFMSSDRLKLNVRSPTCDGLLNNRERETRMLTSVPNTQSHMTQTESLMNSVHVGVQTSPYLHTSPKKATLKCNIKKCVINSKLLRHKGKQKEQILSRYRHPRKSCGDNMVANSLMPFRWKSAIHSLENGTSKCLEYLNSAESKNADYNTEQVFSKQKITLPTDTSKQIGKTSDCLNNRGHEEICEEREQHPIPHSSDRLYSVFEQVSKNVRNSNRRNHQEKDSRADSSDSESMKERSDKRESTKRDKHMAINRKTSNEKQRDENSTVQDLSIQFTYESQEHDNWDKKQMKEANFDNSENQKHGKTLSTQKVYTSLVKSDVGNKDGPKALIADSWSSRADNIDSTESRCVPSRFSDLSKFCVIRPLWKNVNVAEIDRRVNRALRLREELKQNASSGSQARSLIASYFETSSATTTVNSSGWVDAAISSTVVSDFESTNKSLVQTSGVETALFQDASSDNTLCHTVEQVPASSRRSSSSESEHTAQEERESAFQVQSADAESVTKRGHLLWSSTDFRTSSGTTPNQTCRKRSSEDARHGARVTHSVSAQEITASEIACRGERPSSDQTSSQPSNNSSGNSMQVGKRNKNSPPTKISKVENVSTSTPRLVGALVQKLPQVPLSSFVEWFIETSDPNNFVSSDMFSSSSDNSQSNSACFFPLTASSVNDQASSTLWPDSRINEIQENKGFFNNSKPKRAISASSSKKAQSKDTKILSHNDKHRKTDKSQLKYQTTDTTSNTWTSNLTQSFASLVPCTPSSTSYALSCSSGGIDKESVLWMDQVTPNKGQVTSIEADKKVGILKCPSKSISSSKPSTKIPKGVFSKFSFNRKTLASLSVRKGSTKYAKTQKHDFKRQSAIPVRQYLSVRTDTKTTAGKSNEQTDSSTHTGVHPKRDTCRDNAKSDLTKLENNVMAGSTETGHFRHEVSILENKQPEKVSHCSMNTEKAYKKMAKSLDNKTGNESKRPAGRKHGTVYLASSECLEDDYDNLSESLSAETSENIRCAPGIRHILMKLRQTNDMESLAVDRQDRMKITLRKSSDVTGIIAKFQNKQS